MQDQEWPVHSEPYEFAERLLICGIDGRRIAVPERVVERIVPIAQITPLVDAPPPVIGVLNYRGQVLPVVDPRPALGMTTPSFLPDQHLIVVSQPRRFLLWLNSVERIVAVSPNQVDLIGTSRDLSVTPTVLRYDNQVIPVLSPAALFPDRDVPSESAAR